MATTEQTSRHPGERGLISLLFGLIFKIIFFLILALLFSICLEWILMTFVWPELGAGHAREMLNNELRYLNEDFRKSIVTSSPVVFVTYFAEKGYYYLFEWTRFVELLNWLTEHPGNNEFRQELHQFVRYFWEYIEAMLAISQLFFVRLAILLLATPVFVLALIAGVTDGLVQRDLRRWGGGRESSFLYHHAKKVILPAFVSAWIVYLAMPFSVHPSFIILPFAFLSGISAAVAASTFKKYL